MPRFVQVEHWVIDANEVVAVCTLTGEVTFKVSGKQQIGLEASRALVEILMKLNAPLDPNDHPYLFGGRSAGDVRDQFYQDFKNRHKRG